MAGRSRKSKKRSAANSRQPPESLVFFIDECLGSKQLPHALRAAGAVVELHRDHFAPGTDDVEWLRRLEQRHWVVLTKDAAMRRRTAERRAYTDAGLRVFALTAANLAGDEIASVFVRALRRIRRLCASRRGPFVARITRTAAVDVLA
jgi:predicted nuclease of predicted toxin-antitoxin system